jgi:hypothetical protein
MVNPSNKTNESRERWQCPLDDCLPHEIEEAWLMLRLIRGGVVSHFFDKTASLRCAERLERAGLIELGLDLLDGVGFCMSVRKGGRK